MLEASLTLPIPSFDPLALSESIRIMKVEIFPENGLFTASTAFSDAVWLA